MTTDERFLRHQGRALSHDSASPYHSSFDEQGSNSDLDAFKSTFLPTLSSLSQFSLSARSPSVSPFSSPRTSAYSPQTAPVPPTESTTLLVPSAAHECNTLPDPSENEPHLVFTDLSTTVTEVPVPARQSNRRHLSLDTDLLKTPDVSPPNSSGRSDSHSDHSTSPSSAHKKELRHSCDWEGCAMRFHTTSELKSHRRVHTGERPYECDHPGCSKRFAQSGGLVRHRRTHTGDKPYMCTVKGCMRSFTESGHLVRHTATHADVKPHVCPFNCGREFLTHHQLLKHERMHTGEKAYLCPINNCNKPFTQAGSLHRHMQRSHPNEPVPYIPFLGNNPESSQGRDMEVDGSDSEEGSDYSGGAPNS